MNYYPFLVPNSKNIIKKSCLQRMFKKWAAFLILNYFIYMDIHYILFQYMIIVIGVEFLILFSSRSCFLALMLSLKSRQMTSLSEIIIIWVKTSSFDDFFLTTWERENESDRKKEPQIPPYNTKFL